MKFMVVLFSAFLVSLVSARSAQATVYSLINQEISPATALGTITTDGTLGVLSTADILATDITIADGINSANTAGGDFAVGPGADLTATSAGIFFNFVKGETFLEGGYFVAYSPSGDSAYCVANGPTTCGTTANDEGIEVSGAIYQGPVQSGRVEIAVAVVPELSTWNMMVISFVAFGLFACRSKMSAGLAKA